MNETPITVVGRLTADPVLRSTSSGAAMATFRIALNARKKNATTGEYEDGHTSFYNVRAFRSLGANLAACVKKGQAVVVTGTLEITEYDRQDGTKGVNGEILANAVGLDLTWGVTHLTKVARTPAGDSVANDPHVRAALSAMTSPSPEDGEHESDRDTTPYLVIDDNGDTVDPVTGEVRDKAA